MTVFVTIYLITTYGNNKQLLDEVEHDIMNYQSRGLCYLPEPKAAADNTDTRRSVQPFCFWGEHSKGLSNQIDIELDMINVISAADNTFFMSSSQAIVNWLNALDQSDFS